MDNLKELIESLVICNENVFGREITGNIEKINPIFDEAEYYNFEEDKAYETEGSFSTNAHEGFVAILQGNSQEDNYIESLTSLFKSELDTGKKLSVFVTRVELDKEESRVYQLPNEFYVEAIISKMNNEYKVDYCLTDDNSDILITNSKRSTIIKELTLINLKRYRLRIEYKQNNKEDTRIETIEEHSRKRNNSKTTSDKQKINSLLGF